MKTATKFFSLLLLGIALGAGIEADAQGRGKGDRNKGDHEDHYRGKDWDNDFKRHPHRKNARHVVVHRYHRPIPVVVHRAPVRVYHRPARFVYYKEYNTYFDRTRNVYIVFAAGHWMASRVAPIAMRRVNMTTAVCMEVNYFDDDFTAYLDRGGRGW